MKNYFKNCSLTILIVLIGFVEMSCKTDTETEKPKPNVVFLFADDQRSGTYNLGGKGNPEVITPNIDELAKHGSVFHNTYVFGADRSSVCYPSRSMMLSGKNLFRFKDVDTPSKNMDDFNLPVAMRLAGYQTLRSGKGNNVPYGINPEFHTNIEHQNRGSVKGNLEYFNDGMKFIEEWAGKKPFFLYLAVGTPHHPYPADSQAIAMYDYTKITPPEDALVQHPVLSKFGGKSAKLKTMDDVKKDLAGYYASITFMDRKLGELVQLLKDKGVYENTIIMVVGDNGLSIGSHGVFNKSNLMEFGGMHVSLVMTGPGIKNFESNALIYLHDIFPTLCDFCDAPKPKTLDGKSFAPILKGEQTKTRDALLTVFTAGEQRAVRTDKWKLLLFPKLEIYELYDLENDPRELNNLANKEEYKDQLEEMKLLLEKERKAAGDCYPIKAKLPRTYNKKKPFDGNVEMLKELNL
ncbi:MAG: sulfatase-like hydrolase/transferase [Bacteroidales bacterium]|nr:sulfatase-like hydrolase/transferase [Bacteroidales bacterium]